MREAAACGCFHTVCCRTSPGSTGWTALVTRNKMTVFFIFNKFPSVQIIFFLVIYNLYDIPLFSSYSHADRGRSAHIHVPALNVHIHVN